MMGRALAILLLALLMAQCQAQPAKRRAVVVGAYPEEKPSQSPQAPHQVAYRPIAPEECPKDYFRHPLDMEVGLGGTFAEIRSNHFHSGIDLAIGGKVGAPVYAAQDGYVSRINISPWGGGKVLYIDHPNGFRTVYMHLNDFVGDIGSYIRDYQYQHECYAFDINVPEGLLPVKKGQVVAHAGNSGSSGGPHLHYEVRFAATDQVINPLYFGMKYTDDTAPEIKGVRLYASERESVVVNSDTLEAPARFYLGIYAFDRSGDVSGRNGVDRIEMYIDDTLAFRYRALSFLFEESRSVNAIIDYPHYKATREYYIVTRQLPGMRNPNHEANHHGWITLRDTLCHKVACHVFDAKNNRTSRCFWVRTTNPDSIPRDSVAKQRGEPIDFRQGGAVRQSECRLEIPPYALYESDYVTATERSDSRFASKVYGFMPQQHYLPPHVACTITIRLSHPRPDKVVVVSVKGSKYSACTTRREGDAYRAKVKEFGAYALMADDAAPVVKPVNFKEGKSVVRLSALRIKITDDLSGLQRYACYVDGKWELAEYDGKTASLYLPVSLIPSGRHSIKVAASDAVGNTAEKEWSIIK